jgi:hypothetical protein
MARPAKSGFLSVAVFSLLVPAACRDRLFDNPFDPGAGEVVFEVVQTLVTPISSPQGLTWDGSLLWNIDGASNAIVGLNPSNGAMVRTLASPLAGTMDAASDGADLWICSERSADVFKINVLNGDIQKRLSLQRGSFTACEFAQGALWLADALSNKILRVDPETAQILGSFDNPGTRVAGLAFDGLHFWISDPRAISIYELDVSGRILRKYLSPGPSPQGLAFDGRFLWNADANGHLFQLRFGPDLSRFEPPRIYIRGIHPFQVRNHIHGDAALLHPYEQSRLTPKREIRHSSTDMRPWNSASNLVLTDPSPSSLEENDPA